MAFPSNPPKIVLSKSPTAVHRRSTLTLGFHHFPYVSGVFILPVRVLIWGPDQGFPLFACASQASFQRFPRLFFRLRLLRSWGWFFLCGEPVSTLEALRMQRRRSQGWVAPMPTLSHRSYPLLSLRQTPRQALPPGRHLGQLGRAKGGTPLRTSGGCQPGGH